MSEQPGFQHNVSGSLGHHSLVPIPPELTGLPTINAEPWFMVDPGHDVSLEGPAFDRDGNLFVTSLQAGAVLKITQQKQLSTVFADKNIIADGTAFHRDGRLFVACLSGELVVMNPDGSGATYLYPEYEGKPLLLNDLVFDSQGNLYVTDFSGTAMNPTGGVYRLSPDASVVQPVLQQMASPNGISLSPEGNVLWVGETARNTVVRIELLPDGVTTASIDGVGIAYYSTGSPGGPDSSKVDIEGNLYQCIVFQGRAIVLNKRGIPVANVVIPGRDEGKHLGTPNLAFKPGTSQAYIVACGEGGAWVYRFQGLAEGLRLFSHQ